MDDSTTFLLKKKQYLNELKKKAGDNSSPLFKRTVDILSFESEEALRESVKTPNKFQEKILDDNSTFEERFQEYIKEIDNEYK